MDQSQLLSLAPDWRLAESHYLWIVIINSLPVVWLECNLIKVIYAYQGAVRIKQDPAQYAQDTHNGIEAIYRSCSCIGAESTWERSKPQAPADPQVYTTGYSYLAIIDVAMATILMLIPIIQTMRWFLICNAIVQLICGEGRGMWSAVWLASSQMAAKRPIPANVEGEGHMF